MVSVTNSSGAEVAHYRYDAFGNIEEKTGTFESPYQFSTKEYDAASGLSYFGYRFYAPREGRWTGKDPIEFVDGWDRYIFIVDNSINRIDKWGLEVFVCSRDVKGLGGIGAHTWVEIRQKGGVKITYSGTHEKGDKLAVVKNNTPDYCPTKQNPVTSRRTIPPPQGLNSAQWDQAVVNSGEKELQKHLTRSFQRFGGDGGITSGNCHVVTSDVIEGAGGKIPADYDPSGLTPGLRQ